MELEELTPRHALPFGLLALVPLALYGLDSSPIAGVVATTNVLIIMASLYVAFQPVPGHHDHGSNGASV
ncbi:hypothetical protein [Halopiger djelfimassiliensis]|uniref:hypothetical protein n=1 Tax=Halopiger djelfimassiliensis TaxID=1293047 RepID=UPI000677D9B5|nr:hypothetical protein [Halopiger djelfimassiliensis]